MPRQPSRRWSNWPRRVALTRNAEIERQAAKTWRALKELLAALSYDKCWYCESRQDRSLGAVDHFRPKGRLEDDKTHPGYWWLAFEVENYRYTCTLCNSRTTDSRTGTVGGKQDQFPIWDDRKRAKKHGDDFTKEDPKLLDPLIAADTALLTWQVSGSPAPTYGPTQNQKWNAMATLSIAVYHLDHHKLRLARRKIYNALKVLIKEGDILFGKAAAGQRFVRDSLRRVVDSITKLICDEAEYSAAAMQYLTEFRTGESKRKWLDTVVRVA